MPPAIIVENLGKSYRVQHEQMRGGYRTLRESLTAAAVRPINRLRSAFGSQGSFQARSTEEFWALKDIDFEVRPGEVVGIIGRNGAGKSTLLKILSRVTKPTRGRATLYGRVGSLLEVGTGFHPELTGRENIFMNGSVLGMSKREINRHFEGIVDFAEIDQFLDTPVKRYSSGMQVRLAFAVAAHLEPEILMIDEVLAVGDARFQRKCLGKMGEVANQGRTILFVSHDLGNVMRLCSRAILLNGGLIEASGDVNQVIAQYLRECDMATDGIADLTSRGDRSGSGHAQFRSIELVQGSCRSASLVFGAPLTIKLTVEVREFIGPPSIAVVITTSDGGPVHDLWNEGHLWSGEVGTHDIAVSIPQLRLYPGAYTINLWMGDLACERVDYIKNATTFEVVQTPESGVSRTLRQTNGVVFQESRWESSLISDARL